MHCANRKRDIPVGAQQGQYRYDRIIFETRERAVRYHVSPIEPVNVDPGFPSFAPHLTTKNWVVIFVGSKYSLNSF